MIKFQTNIFNIILLLMLHLKVQNKNVGLYNLILDFAYREFRKKATFIILQKGVRQRSQKCRVYAVLDRFSSISYWAVLLSQRGTISSDWCQTLCTSCQNGNKSTASENALSQLQPDAISLMFRSLLSSSICASVYLLFRIKITSARGIRTVMVLYYLRRSFHKKHHFCLFI